MTDRVAGIDAFGRGAWVAIVLEDGRYVRDVVARSLSSAVGRLGDCLVIAVDIPIGLPDRAPRQADVLARQRLGPRASSVFPTPLRAVLEAPTFASAQEVSRRMTGTGVSLQAYGMARRIFEAEDLARADARIVEVHPEVSFRVIAGSPLIWPKDSWLGTPLRAGLLSSVGIVLPDSLVEANAVPPNDVLDAAVAAWSAERVRTMHAITLPDPPELHADGLPSAIRV